MIEFSKINSPKELDKLKNKSASYKNLKFSFSDDYILKLKQLIEESNSCQFFAKNEKDEIVGYIAGAEKLHINYFTIYELFVDPNYQGSGIGTELVSKLLKYAKNLDLKGIRVQTEFENVPAQRLYEKLGFIKFNNSDWSGGITYQLNFKSCEFETEIE